jgi:hypothetical protein
MRAVALAGLIIISCGASSAFLTAAANSQTTEAPTTECDTYAADPFDPQRKADGVPFEKINPALAIPACESAVRQYPNSKRLTFQLGRAFDKNADFSSALIQYRQAAAQGYAPAQNAVGVAYSLGNGVLKDEMQAAIWLRKAAEQGNASAQSNLAIAYEFGRGVARDILQAVAWHRKAAEQGVADSQVTLGFYYENGLGVEKDEAKAVVWFRKAAEQGDANGQNDLGVMYQYGRGVTKDKAQAIDWYRKAAEQGNEAAKKKMAEMKETKQAPSPAATTQGTVQWDQNKVLQNAQFNYAINETRVCVRGATTIALQSGQRDRETIKSFVISLCKAQLSLVFIAAKAAKMPSEQQTAFVMSLINNGVELALRSGQ